ncbi:hypothetical protein [Gluconacetobacter entanii]|uniref:hypothetical protein n=1 Tax=Gluconacetobacter entanii TaxID=108528 RepID=UPI00142DA589|nr:hypothetical protein [Gluconacetobacter entanii]MCE2578912.1 hypothetical protein [Komagataeibacter sp. FNDCR1]
MPLSNMRGDQRFGRKRFFYRGVVIAYEKGKSKRSFWVPPFFKKLQETPPF